MIWITAVIETVLIALLYYPILRFVRGTRGAGVLKGLGFIVVAGVVIVLLLGRTFQLDRIYALAKSFLEFAVIGFLIIFQPEIRRGLTRLGKNPFLRLFEPRKTSTAAEILDAVVKLSASRVGALIAIERDVGLRAVVETGIPVDAEVSSAIIMTLFWPGSPLHDKGMVIEHDRIVAASCVFPLTESTVVSKELGTRHRAAIGLSEESDALVVVVSEETGIISVAHKGQLVRNLSRDDLQQLFAAIGRGEEDVLWRVGGTGE